MNADCLMAVGVATVALAKLFLNGPRKLLVALTVVAANFTNASSVVSFIARFV